jgi:hypothetical protein
MIFITLEREGLNFLLLTLFRFPEAGKFCQYTSTDICTKNGQPGVGKANFAFCVNNGLCKAKVEDNEAHPGCDCEEGFTGNHCEFLEDSMSGSNSSGTTSGSDSTSSASVSSADSSDVEQANHGVVVAVSSIVVAVVVIMGLFVLHALVRGGRFANKGKTGVEVGAAVAEAENEASAPSDTVDAVSTGSGHLPFDENRYPLQGKTARFDEDEGEFEDVDDYSNDRSDTSTLTEDDNMSSVQIV